MSKLLPCPDCGHLCSRLATTCPGCGRPLSLKPKTPTPPPQLTSKQAVYVVLVGLLIFFSFYCITLWVRSSNNSTQDFQADDSAAWVAAMTLVKEQLKSPASAKFPFEWMPFVTSLGSNKFRVAAWVDSQNSFGAMLRSNFTCEITINPDTYSGTCTILPLYN